MQESTTGDECTRRNVVLVAQKLDGLKGPVQIGTHEGKPIIAEVFGTPRPFPNGPQLRDEELPRDPAILGAHYTVLKVLIGNEIVLQAGWSEHGWFGYIQRGSWEADLVWALA